MPGFRSRSRLRQSVAAPTCRWRLNTKTAPPELCLAAERSSRAVRKCVREKKSLPTRLQSAVKAGLVPKARKTLALFLKDSLPRVQGVGEGRDHQRSKVAAVKELWHALSPGQKSHWSELSRREFDTQRHAAMLRGLPLRRSQGPPQSEPGPEVIPPDQSNTLSPALGVNVGAYTCEEILGRGSYGTVVKALHIGHSSSIRTI